MEICTMSSRSRTRIVRLALIEGVVIAVGFGLVSLIGAAACVIDPHVLAATVLPPTAY
jgi:hypothetical protein